MSNVVPFCKECRSYGWLYEKLGPCPKCDGTYAGEAKMRSFQEWCFLSWVIGLTVAMGTTTYALLTIYIEWLG